MGLEIQDDEHDQAIFKGSQITSDVHVDRANQLRWVKENFVDLGLPSGTLWARHNLGATCEQNAKSWYGDYYAWGETTTKDDYCWDTYKHGETYNTLTKYTGDDIQFLEPEDDVANVTLGHDYRMPSKEQCEELINNTTNEWVDGYGGIVGLNGRIFTGPNGNKMFIPVTGYYFQTKISHPGGTYIWSNTIDEYQSSHAYNLWFNDEHIMVASNARCYGRTVRAVL